MYADTAFYKNSYFGKVIPDAELDFFLSSASDSVDQLTFFRISEKGGIDKLTVFQQKQVRLAVCVQADFLYSVQDIPQFVKSFSNVSNSVTRADKGSIRYSDQAIAYLRPTNMLYMGLGS